MREWRRVTPPRRRTRLHAPELDATLAVPGPSDWFVHSICQFANASYACAHENNTGAGGFAATPPSCIALCATTALSFRPHPAAACVCVREPWWAGLGRASARTLYVGLMRLVNPTGGSQMQAALHAAGRPRPRRRARAYTLPVLSPFRWNVRMPARLG